MAAKRSVWVRRILYALGGLVAAYVFCGLGSFTLIYVLKGRAPDDVKAVVEPRLDAIRRFASASAARCPEVRNTGLLAQLEGRIPRSPAVGSELERWPEIVDVRVGCFWWSGADRGSAAGNHFLPLRNVERVSSRSSEGEWEISRGFFPGGRDSANHEVTTWWREEPDLVDVKIARPLPTNDGYIEVEVTLRRRR